MICFDQVTVTYAGQDEPAIRDVNLDIDEGVLALSVGPTGAGKSTLLRCVNGLVPHFSGGHLSGRVLVDGRSTAQFRPRDLADVVGFVGQDPDSSFVADIVEDELAYGMENLGIEPSAMRRRVEDVLDMMSLHSVRRRPVRSLSGGQRQRVAIGAALTTAPRLLVLDEPTSSLDPLSAEEVLAALSRMVHDQGVTILVAEHRLERIVHLADLVVAVGGGAAGPGAVVAGDPATMLASSAIAPPVVRLARLAGWSPVPLSVREARRLAPGLRATLAGEGGGLAGGGAFAGHGGLAGGGGPELGRIANVTAGYGTRRALDRVDLTLYEGEVVAVMGRNGSGKTTMLRALVGLRRPELGSVSIRGQDPSRLRPRDAVRLVGLVPQEAGSLLGAGSVAAECSESDHDGLVQPGTTRSVLDELASGIDDRLHPRDLSEGQRLCLALAIVLAPAPPLVLLDEPTRGLDYGAKGRLSGILRRLASMGHGVVVATHDVELAAEVADRVVVLADGEIITDGPAREVVRHSPGLAPQVARILAPAEWLTVDEVAAALLRLGAREPQ